MVEAGFATPAISGGTLLALAREGFVAASDPDLSRVLVVDTRADRVTAVLLLPAGAEPGRLAQDATGRVHVALRGSGELASFEPHGPHRRLTRRAVCPMPRGVATDGRDVHVACRGGELVTFSGDAPTPSRRLRLERDLRDVAVVGNRLYVTRFRSAQVLVVDAQGNVANRTAPATRPGFANRVAWRARAVDDELFILHQRDKVDPIGTSVGAYGSRSPVVGCAGVVQSAMSRALGSQSSSTTIPGAPLPVDFDVAVGEDGEILEVVVVSAGTQNGFGSVLELPGPAIMATTCARGASPLVSTPIDNAVAVARLPDGSIVVQQRAPARLTVITGEAPTRTGRSVALGGRATFDTGHALFHAATASRIACASCHPEGGDDGHTWSFVGIGRRRTPALHDVAGSAPFHWTGELPNMSALFTQVFVQRMSGRPVTAAHVSAVEQWIGHLRRPRASVTDPAAVARGRRVFDAAGCRACHGGPRLSNGESRDVGTGAALQVPSLHGVADRLPVMHTGCATTLRDRFTQECGGASHGAVDADQLDDLIAYLESL